MLSGPKHHLSEKPNPSLRKDARAIIVFFDQHEPLRRLVSCAADAPPALRLHWIDDL
jgi:hypothetical protein